MAAAILSKLTSKDRAKELAGKAREAAASLYGSSWATSTSRTSAHERDSTAGGGAGRGGEDEGGSNLESERERQLRLDRLALLDRSARLSRKPYHSLGLPTPPPRAPHRPSYRTARP